jgi:hypothetical protein
VIRRFLVLFTVLFVLSFPSLASARGCSEVSDVTGEKKCSRFGALWSLEGTTPILFRFGMRYSNVTTDDLTFSADKTKNVGQSIPYAWNGRALGLRSVSSVGADGGLGFFVVGQLYTGLETHISLGHVTTRDGSVQARGQTLRLTNDDGANTTVFGGAIPIGYRIPLGRAAIRPEMAFGFEMIDISHSVTPPDGREWVGTAIAYRGVVEPRIVGEIWFTQHIAFAIAGGINVIGGSADHSLGISLAWHHRAFDGSSTF